MYKYNSVLKINHIIY